MSGHTYRRQSKKERDAATAERLDSRRRKEAKTRSKELEAGQHKKPRS
ncbi:MAG TPA: hypothetical protein VJR47_00245 [Stellaceae bacterium]|nr:hypothetical protein [Stellaceae bacterium]